MTTVNPSLQAARRRESSYLLLFASMLLCALAAFAAMRWMVLSTSGMQNALILVGDASQYPPADKPYRISELASRPSRTQATHELPVNSFWLVNINGKLHAFSPFATPPANCIYAWNDATMRFVDPCSGAKFRLDGVVIGGPSQRDLDQFAVTIVDGQVQVDLNERYAGTCRAFNQVRFVTHPIEWKEASDPPVCDQ